VSFASFTTSSSTHRAAGHLAAAALLIGALTACTSAGSGGAPTAPAASPSTGSSPSHSDSPALPAPGSTIAAPPIASPDAIPTGLTIAVIAPDISGDAAADTTAAVAELRAVAELHGAASIRILPGDATGSGDTTEPIDPDTLLQTALADEPDVIVVLGEGILGDLDSASAANLGQQFVLLGAQLPEPTVNVTAVVWPGADVRLSDGISAEMAPRAHEALEVGLAAVAAHTTGIVLALR
jgi:hypothetical protein